MAVEIKSKRAVVSKAPHELYMAFVDMRNFVQFLPEEKRQGVTADYDSIHAEVQGFNIGVKVCDRMPYSKIITSLFPMPSITHQHHRFLPHHYARI